MKHILAAGIIHESHGFNKIPTTLDHFDIQLGQEIRERAIGDSEFTGLFEIADTLGWKVTHPIRAEAEPSGIVTRECFEDIWKHAERSMKENGPFDAVFWVLHGAMSVDGIDDVEGEIVSRTRDILGDEIPIAVTLDLHAILTPLLVEKTDIICGYQTTPHIDLQETARRAAGLLSRTLEGEIHPVTYSIHPPVLIGLDHGRTTDEEAPIPRMLRHFQDAQLEDPNLLDASFFSGFPYGDFAGSGASAAIVVDCGSKPVELLEHFGEQIINTRDHISVSFATMEQAIETAQKTSGSGPFLIGDFTDTSQGGAYGDSPNALRVMLEMGIIDAACGLIWDPSTVEQAHKAGVGANIDALLGGHAAPELGRPLNVRARVTHLSEDGGFIHKGPYFHNQTGQMGKCAALNISGIDVVVSNLPSGIVDREQFRVLGINAEEKDIVVVKAYNHFRADFEPIGRGLIYADTGGLMTLDFARFDYEKVRRPIWPLDEIKPGDGLTLRARSKIGDGWE